MLDPWALVSAILAVALVLHYIHAAARERMFKRRLSSSNAALRLAISFDRRRAAEPVHPEQGKML